MRGLEREKSLWRKSAFHQPHEPRDDDLRVRWVDAAHIVLHHVMEAVGAECAGLPAPDGPLRLALRAYLPRQRLRNRTWRVPPLMPG